MFDDLDPRSPTPLYEQIASRVRVAVASGDLSPGDPLPSVRQLAGRLRVNPSTVVQAYRDLEGEGFVALRHGSGTFVQEVSAGRKEEEAEQQAAGLVRKMLSDAARLGLDVNVIVDAFGRETGVRLSESKSR